MSRRKKLGMPDHLMLVGIVAGTVYLFVKYVADLSSTAAGYPAVAVGALLLGACLRPLAVRLRDHIARRLGVQIVPAKAPTKGRRP